MRPFEVGLFWPVLNRRTCMHTESPSITVRYTKVEALPIALQINQHIDTHCFRIHRWPILEPTGRRRSPPGRAALSGQGYPSKKKTHICISRKAQFYPTQATENLTPHTLSTSSEQAMEKLSEAETEPGERVLRVTDSGVMVLERGPCPTVIILAPGEALPWRVGGVFRALSSDRREPWRTDAWKAPGPCSSEHSSFLRTSGEPRDASARDSHKRSSKPPCGRS